MSIQALIIMILICTNAITLILACKMIDIVRKQDKLLEQDEIWIDPDLIEEDSE